MSLSSGKWRGWIIFLCGLLSLILFGIVGVGRDHHYVSNFNMDYLFVAGWCWRLGLSPYDSQTFLNASHLVHSFPVEPPFAYPPQSGFFCLFLSFFPLWAARIWMTSINVVCALFLAYACSALVQKEIKKPLSLWILAGIVVGNPLTAHVVWMGQTSLIAAAGVVGGWYLLSQHKPFASGILFGICSIKPQLVFLPLLWILLERQWKALGMAFAMAMAMSIVPFYIEGIVGTFNHWLAALKEYQDFLWAQISFENVFGLRSLAWSVGISLPSLIPLGILLTIAMWFFRRYLIQKNILAILLGLSALIIYAHDYDLVIISPLFGSVWLLAQDRLSAKAAALSLLAGFFFPQRMIKKISEHNWIWHTREIILFIALAWLGLSSISLTNEKEKR